MESIQTDPMFFGAKYLLIHKRGQLETGDIWKITETRPKILTKAEMLALDYKPTRDFYLVYSIERMDGGEFKDLSWDISSLKDYSGGRQSANPFAVSLADLMKVTLDKI